MKTKYTKEELERAEAQLEKTKSYYMHVMSYIIVCTGLLLLNLFMIYKSKETLSDIHFNQLWSLWVFFGWGIGLFSHSVHYFFRTRFFSKQWEKRKLEEYLKKEV